MLAKEVHSGALIRRRRGPDLPDLCKLPRVVKKNKGDATTPCYMVLAKPAKDGDEEDDEEVELEGYRINSALYGMIEDPRSGHPENFKIETKDDREPGAQ